MNAIANGCNGGVNNRKRCVNGKAGGRTGRGAKQEHTSNVDGFVFAFYNILLLMFLKLIALTFVVFSGQPEPMSEEYSSTDPWDSSKALLELLLKSEEKIKSLRETVIKETGTAFRMNLK
jgi:hypothetical protein